MIITGYRLYRVPPRWLFLKVETSEGLVGWGEPIVEGQAETTARAVQEAFKYLLGEDPRLVEDHWQALSRMQFYRGGPIASSAVAGIDQALWDITGKALGVPVHMLFGGYVRERVRAYAPVHGDSLSELKDQVGLQLSRGITAVKMAPNPRPVQGFATHRNIDEMVERVRVVREMMGADGDVALEFHGRLTTADARRILPELEAFRPLFAEEPVLPEFASNVPLVVAASRIPIALGERLYSRWDFASVLDSGISVAQPDVSHAGGLSEVRRIAAAAETRDVAVAPHCPLGPIALAASLQIDFAVPNFLIQEQHLDAGSREPNALLDSVMDTSPFQLVEGAFVRTTRPGLGVEIDESAVIRAAASGHDWRTPMWRHHDGSHAIW